MTVAVSGSNHLIHRQVYLRHDYRTQAMMRMVMPENRLEVVSPPAQEALSTQSADTSRVIRQDEQTLPSRMTNAHASTNRRRGVVRLRQAARPNLKVARIFEAAAEELVDRLLLHLSALVPDDDDEEEDDWVYQQSHQQQVRSSPGITLPASAIGWLVTQIHFENDSLQDSCLATTRQHYYHVAQSSFSMSNSALRDKLTVLTTLLPRLTHLRITNTDWPADSNYARRGSSDGDDPWSDYLASMQRRPRVNLSLFGNCKVLLLDQVPSEWIYNLHSLRKSLQVLRVERCCIYDLPALLIQSTFDSAVDAGNCNQADDPLHNPASLTFHEQESLFRFSKLTHIKFSHCELNDASGLANRLPDAPPPLSRMMHLTSVCLSHNNLSSQRSIVAGLSSKVFLTSLDVSFNNLRSAKLLALHLANLTTLNLSHNTLTHTRGLDKLQLLQTLYMDHNQIADVSHMANVARLPELRVVTIQGNPVQQTRPRGVRVDVLDLFREQRMPRLAPGASYRQLQQVLPVMDGKLANMGELKAIRNRTYLRAETIVFANVEENWVSVDRRQEDGFKTERNLSNVVRLRKRRRAKRRRATIKSSFDEPMSSSVYLGGLGDDPEHRPLVSFTLDDVMSSLSLHDTVLEAKDEKVMAKGSDGHEPGNYAIVGIKNGGVSQLSHEEPGVGLLGKNELSADLDHVIQENDSVGVSVPNAETAMTESKDGGGHLDTEMSTFLVADGDKDDLDNKQDTYVNSVDESLHSVEDVSHIVDAGFDTPLLSPIKHYDDDELIASAATTATTLDTQEEPRSPPAFPVCTDEHPQLDHDERLSGTEESRAMSPSTHDSDVSSSQPSQSPFQQNFRHVASFGGLIQDESMNASFGSPRSERAQVATQKSMLQQAEAKSVYVGPKLYATISILENLDLYFRMFVFDMSAQRVDGDGVEFEDECVSVLEYYPKIQLWPIDRRYREGIKEKAQLAGKIAPKEGFRRVWQEKIVACGHPALRRLTPNRAARLGFHGELLWSAANTNQLKPETIAENRDTILCLTDLSLYIILDHDSVTDKTKDQQRAFPLPIGRDATFDKATWPHALAYHPLQTLQSISIGFGFQRLTLRFANTTFPVPDDFTYVLLTSSKSKTIMLLKEIQSLANESKISAALTVTDCEVLIDNDDRHVLDALGAAVAPDQINVVVHYQILAQRWKKGDRGIVRRVVVVTDMKLYLLDEDYVGDGSESIDSGPGTELGDTMYRMVDAADLVQVSAIQAADADPVAITISINPSNRLARTHNWRLVCRDGIGAERLVEDVRKAIALLTVAV